MRHDWKARACVAALGLAVWSGPSLAQDEQPKWVARADDEFAVLAFEVPDSDDQRFYVQCDNKKRITSFSLFDEIKRSKKGQPVTIEIVNGADKVVIKGKTTTDELNAYIYAAAERFPIAPLVALLERAGEVTARAATASMKLPDVGRAEAVKEFRAKCQLP